VAELRFTWDDRKAAANATKHGVSFEEAQWVFYDEHALVTDDPDHSEGEDRSSSSGSVARCASSWSSTASLRMRRSIRLISARKANKTEQRQYLERLKK
jgi:uncharacterized protein